MKWYYAIGVGFLASGLAIGIAVYQLALNPIKPPPETAKQADVRLIGEVYVRAASETLENVAGWEIQFLDALAKTNETREYRDGFTDACSLYSRSAKEGETAVRGIKIDSVK